MKTKSLEKMLQEQKLNEQKKSIKKVLRANEKKTIQIFNKMLKEQIKDDYFDDQNLISKKNVLLYFKIKESKLREWRDNYNFPPPIYKGREVYFDKTEVKNFKRP
jgi:hypothetical protein